MFYCVNFGNIYLDEVVFSDCFLRWRCAATVSSVCSLEPEGSTLWCLSLLALPVGLLGQRLSTDLSHSMSPVNIPEFRWGQGSQLHPKVNPEWLWRSLSLFYCGWVTSLLGTPVQSSASLNNTPIICAVFVELVMFSMFQRDVKLYGHFWGLACTIYNVCFCAPHLNTCMWSLDRYHLHHMMTHDITTVADLCVHICNSVYVLFPYFIHCVSLNWARNRRGHQDS